jgi:hypothetical protein
VTLRDTTAGLTPGAATIPTRVKAAAQRQAASDERAISAGGDRSKAQDTERSRRHPPGPDSRDQSVAKAVARAAPTGARKESSSTGL